MARSNKKLTKPKVSSKVKKIPKIGWGQSNKNISTLKKLEKIKFDEKDGKD